MKRDHDTMETTDMKLKLIVGRLLILTVALSLLFSALPVVAADGPLLHNSNRFSGTTKHGGSWGLPGTKYGEFSCATCHDRNTGNIKRVRNTLPSAPDTGSGDFPGAGASITFQDVRANSSDFGDDGRALKTESNNICEVCHSYDAAQLTGVKFHGYDMSGPGDVGHYNKADCITCHPHSQGFKPLACDSCHGNPPTVATAGGPNGFADNPYSTGSATVGAHTAHAVTQSLACTNCHDGYNMPQESTANPGFGDISISFNNYGSVTGSYTGQSGVSYNDGLGAGGQTCNTVYCHSNGQSADGTSATPSAYSAPTWSGGAACGSCHSDTDPATGSHTEHIGAGAVCNDCHSGNTHVDRVIDVTVGAYTAGGAPGNNYGTCSTASCHDDGTGSPATTQDWGTTINDCSECHGNVPGTGAHAKHFAAVGTLIDAFDCSDCHKDATKGGSAPTGGEHRDGNIDVYNSNPDVGGGTTDLGYATDVATTSPGYATETCNTSYCHGDNMPKGTTSGNTNAPTWGATSTGCTFCHDMAPAAIGAHAGKTLTQCIDCHGPGSGSVNASGTGFTNGGATHMDGTVQGGGDNCTDCHAADIDDTKNGVHASHTDVATLLAGKTVTGNDYGNASWWYTTTWVSGAPKFGCGECHPAGEGTGHPVSGLNVDIDPGGESPSAGSPKLKNTNSPSTPTMNSGTSVTCQNVYCHSSGEASPSYTLTPDWYGGSVSGDCNDCHGNAPSSNAHALHAVGIHYDTLYDDDSVGLMATDPTGTGASGGADAAHGNSATSDTIGCQTCHNDTVAVEYNAANSLCSSCHTDSNSPAQGHENAIINTAGSTHLNTQPDVVFASLTGFKTKAQVRDDITSVTELDNSWGRTNNYKAGAGNSYDAAKALAPNHTAGDCSNIVCHNGNAATWTDTNVSCLYCHTSLP